MSSAGAGSSAKVSGSTSASPTVELRPGTAPAKTPSTLPAREQGQILGLERREESLEKEVQVRPAQGIGTPRTTPNSSRTKPGEREREHDQDSQRTLSREPGEAGNEEREGHQTPQDRKEQQEDADPSGRRQQSEHASHRRRSLAPLAAASARPTLRRRGAGARPRGAERRPGPARRPRAPADSPANPPGLRRPGAPAGRGVQQTGIPPVGVPLAGAPLAGPARTGLRHRGPDRRGRHSSSSPSRSRSSRLTVTSRARKAPNAPASLHRRVFHRRPRHVFAELRRLDRRQQAPTEIEADLGRESRRPPPPPRQCTGARS